jgi:short-subunit dehydrogenase
MKKICVITGASSGIGKEFFAEIVKDGYFKFDEYWVIARGAARLEELKSLTSTPVRAIPLDLSRESSFEEYRKLLDEEKPEIGLLINCSGFGKFDSTVKVGYEVTMNMIDLNAKALTAITYLTLPYMERGSEIYQLGSLSSFQPVPYIGVYGASKAYVLSFTRALGMELKPRGIRVMAVCPFWVKTEFFNRAITDDTIVYYARYYEAQGVVKQALRDMKRGKDISIHGKYAQSQVFLTKLLPHKAVMKIWCKQQKKPIK